MKQELISGVPRHEQVSDWLREQIESEIYTTNQQLPSESQIGLRFDVSRITVRRALQTLEHEGLIYRRQGLGSFVKGQRVRQGLVRLTDFVEDMTHAGVEGSSRVLHFGPEISSPLLTAHFNFEKPQSIFRLDRLRLGNGTPVAFDRTWMPVFYAHLIQDHNLKKETIYNILERDYKIPVLYGRYRIEATNADQELADQLQVDFAHALLLITRLSSTKEGKKIYYQKRFYRSDRVTYEMMLERDTMHNHPKRGMALREFEPRFWNQQ